MLALHVEEQGKDQGIGSWFRFSYFFSPTHPSTISSGGSLKLMFLDTLEVPSNS